MWFILLLCLVVYIMIGSAAALFVSRTLGESLPAQIFVYAWPLIILGFIFHGIGLEKAAGTVFFVAALPSNFLLKFLK